MTALPDQIAHRWQPDRTVRQPTWHVPGMLTAVGRGLMNRCPACGRAHVFQGFLRVVPECANCGAPLGLARADDAPPYFTIILVGHMIVPLMLLTERGYAPPTWVMTAIFVPLALVLSVGLLRPIKGATVGLMLKLDLLKTDADA